MIHMPSERVFQALCANDATFSIDLGDDKIPSIIYKNDSLLLKQVSLGKTLNVKIYEIDYLEKSYILLIHTLEKDVNTHFHLVCSIEEYNALIALITSSNKYYFLFDETNSSQAGSTNININYEVCDIETFKTKKFQLYNFSQTIPDYENLFDNIERLYGDGKGTLLIDMSISALDWKPSTAVFLSNTGQAPRVSILDRDEGQFFNDQVATLLIRLFDKSPFLNPQAQIDVNKREMTDILCVEEEFLLLFETKVQSVFGERNPDKINNSILKNIHKAIEQLKGANTWYQKKCKIFDNKEREIKLNYDLFTFNIIMVSNYPIFDDDNSCFKSIEKVFNDKDIMIIILDTKMLQSLIKYSKKDKIKFYASLISIFQTYIKNKTLNIEIKLPN